MLLRFIKIIIQNRIELIIIQNEFCSDNYGSETELDESSYEDDDYDSDGTIYKERELELIFENQFKQPIDRIITVCKFLRQSKNQEVLNKYTDQVLVCPTIWSSLFKMIQKFIMLFSEIQKVS